MQFRFSTLPNGLRIATDVMPSVRSVAIGCWVDTGSRDETPVEAGASHFLEHLLFKGSEQMTAHDISEAFDSMGARHNAFTSKEYTCYWAQMRDADLEAGLEILAEMLQRPAFRSHEIDSERQVVLEEINMNEDDPTDVAHERFVRRLWEGHPLSPPILGSRESITAMTRTTIHDYWARRYRPGSVVVAAAGHVDHDLLVAEVERRFGAWEGPPLDHDGAAPVSNAGAAVTTRDTEQVHLVFGGAGLRRDDERRFANLVVDHVLGSGMSSRLFRSIREERGLAYAVNSFRLPYSDAGAWGVYVGTTPHQAAEVVHLIRTELDRLMADGLTDAELTRAKGHVAGSLALSVESPNSRMIRLGRTETTRSEHLTVDEIVARVDAVTRDDALEVAGAVFSGPYVVGATGPFTTADLEPLTA